VDRQQDARRGAAIVVLHQERLAPVATVGEVAGVAPHRDHDGTRGRYLEGHPSQGVHQPPRLAGSSGDDHRPYLRFRALHDGVLARKRGARREAKNFNELPPVRRGNRAAPLPHVRHRNPRAGIDARPRPPLRIAYK